MKKFFLLFGMIIYLSNLCFSQWEACNTGLNTVKSKTVYAFCIKGDNIFAGTSDGIFVSSDNGLTWTARNNGNYLLDIYTLATKNDLLFAGGWGGVFISKDDGMTWLHKGNGIVDSVVSTFEFIDDKIFIGSMDNNKGGRVYVSTDVCETWTKKEINVPVDSVTGESMTKIASLKAKGNLLFASVNAAFGNHGVFLSRDFGENWENKGIYINPFDVINSLVFDETDLYLGAFGENGGVYKSSNNGDNWKLLNNGLKITNKDTRVNVLFNTDNMIIAGMSARGIFISSDKANIWHENNNGLTNLTIKAITKKNDYIFVGTYGGIFRAKIDDLTDVEDYKNIELNINITPNPISSLATISFTNSDLSNPTISIYNSLGIEIKRFKNTELSGNSSINFTTEEFPSGMYYCTLSSGINKITKSFVVVK